MNQQFLIYGKIILDSIRLRSGDVRRNTLGGGGPQAAFGMRLWHSSVALLTRSGTDLEPEHEQTLRQLGLAGVRAAVKAAGALRGRGSAGLTRGGQRQALARRRVAVAGSVTLGSAERGARRAAR